MSALTTTSVALMKAQSDCPWVDERQPNALEVARLARGEPGLVREADTRDAGIGHAHGPTHAPPPRAHRSRHSSSLHAHREECAEPLPLEHVPLRRELITAALRLHAGNAVGHLHHRDGRDRKIVGILRDPPGKDRRGARSLHYLRDDVRVEDDHANGSPT